MKLLPNGLTPREAGYSFPAEWYQHDATWLSWPHKDDSWPGKIGSIYPPYLAFIKAVAEGEHVNINVNDENMREQVIALLETHHVDPARVTLHIHPTNDAWCRDHGPAFLLHRETHGKLIVDWGYNAWGDKYPPYDLDNRIPALVAESLGLPFVQPGIVMEGGSVDFNGNGSVLTTTSCLLNPNRNPDLDKAQIETFLRNYYGVEQILWLGEGIIGDDTDGHIDDLTRFVSKDTVITMIEENASDENYSALRDNVTALERMKLMDGNQLNIIEIPMPDPVYHEGQRLPASYANFYIANSCVVVPTFRCANDDRALDILQACFTDRTVIGIDSTDLIWGLGSFHCLSQQEPAGVQSTGQV